MKISNVHVPLLLDTATYLGIATMSLLGISGFSVLRIQLIALGLCILFAMLYRIYFKTGAYQRNPNLYFGVQAFVLTLVLALGSSSTDAFNFLFLLLTIHTALVLPGKHAAVWIAIYYSIVSIIVLLIRGMEGLYAILFYLITYVVCGFFGNVLQQAELARDKNQHLVDELQASQKKVQELAVVEERNRLARDLHDSVKQQVFAISMQLSAARATLSEADKAYPSIVEAERLSQQAGTELTTLINALRPPALEHRTLAVAVRDHVQEWSRQNKTESEIWVDDVSVTADVEQVLFRVLQEALANVARHSHAGKVLVTLKSENNDVVLSVNDNGAGFDEKQIAKGIGLESMSERLATINGTLSVSSRPSEGTSVTAIVRRS